MVTDEVKATMNDEELNQELPPETLSDMFYTDRVLRDYHSDEEMVYDSRNSHELHKIFWYSMYDEILTSRTLSKNKKTYICYDMSEEYDMVGSAEMEIKIPEIKVKEYEDQEIQIALCRDFCIHFIKEAKLVLDHNQLDCSAHAMMILKNFFTNKPYDLDELIGNDKCTEFSSSIDMKYFNFPLMWDHSSHETKSIPLFYFTKHYYLFDFEENISSLIRMRKREIDHQGRRFGEWEEIPTDMNLLLNKNITIDTPNIFVLYRKIPEDEKNWLLRERKPLIYNDFIVDETKNVINPGKTTKIKPDIPDNVGVQSFFFYAFSPEKRKIGLHSNFQNKNKKCPIKTFTLSYAKHVIKENNQRVERFQEIKAYQHFPSKPRDKSISAVPLCQRPGSLFTDRSVDLSDKKVRFDFKMRKENSESYHVVLITMVTRKILCPEPGSFNNATTMYG